MKTYEGFFDAERRGGLRVTGPDGLKELISPDDGAEWGPDANVAWYIVRDAYDGDGEGRSRDIADEYCGIVYKKLIRPMNPEEPMTLSWYDVTGLVNELIQRDGF